MDATAAVFSPAFTLSDWRCVLNGEAMQQTRLAAQPCAVQLLESRRLLSALAPPIADAGSDRVGAAGVPIMLSFGGSDPAVIVPKFTVNYGDGTPETVLNNALLKVPLSFPHTYAQKGAYTVTLTIEDGDGGTITDTAQISVGDVAVHLFQDVDGNGLQHVDKDQSLPSHTVWLDLNENGAVDDGEPAAATDTSGDAMFDGLAPGTYKVRTEAPVGWQVTFADGTVHGDACDATINGSFGAGCVFGLTQRAMVTGTIYHDLNSNGVRDADEPTLANRGVIASTLTELFAGRASTFANGFYRIRGLLPGDHQIRFNDSADWLQTFPTGNTSYSVSLAAGETVENIDFGIVLTATARGFVFEDVNSDGLFRDPDRIYTTNDHIWPATVYLDLNNDGVHEADERMFKTYGDGTWVIDRVPPGTRTFRLLPRPGWVETTPGVTVDLEPGEVMPEIAVGTHQTDFSPPQLSSFVFRYDLKPQVIELTFSEAVDVTPDDLKVQVDGGSSIQLDLTSYDPATQRAIFTPRGSGVLADGNYRAVIDEYVDMAGNVSGSDERSFFALKGDLNRDRIVSIADFIKLSSNFGKTDATYADGDVNYDGAVSISDFIDLAANFNKIVAASTPAMAPQSPAAESLTVSSPATQVLQQNKTIDKRNRDSSMDWHPRRRLHHRANRPAIG
jgi:PKD repeat protein